MFPIPENCLVITEYVEDWNSLNDTPCIVIMNSQQTFLFKMVTSKIETDRSLNLHSLNPAYIDQDVFAGDVLEVWKYHSHITDVLPSSESMLEGILRAVHEIKVDVKKLSK